MAREQKKERDRRKRWTCRILLQIAYIEGRPLNAKSANSINGSALCMGWKPSKLSRLSSRCTATLPWDVVQEKSQPYSHILCAIFIYFSHNFLDPFSLQRFSISFAFFVQLVFFLWPERSTTLSSYRREQLFAHEKNHPVPIKILHFEFCNSILNHPCITWWYTWFTHSYSNIVETFIQHHFNHLPIEMNKRTTSQQY